MRRSLYVATKFSRKDEAREIFEKAVARGWTIAEDWTRHDKVEIEEMGISIAEQRAQDDIDGAMNADVFIMLVDEPGPGMYVELGAVIASSIIDMTPLIIIICPKELKFRSIFFYHPNVFLLDRKRMLTNGGIETVLDEAEKALSRGTFIPKSWELSNEECERAMIDYTKS